MATGNFSRSWVSITLKGHCAFSPIFVSLKPKWEPFRLSNALLKIDNAVGNRLSAIKCDGETLHLEARAAARAGRGREGARRQGRRGVD